MRFLLIVKGEALSLLVKFHFFFSLFVLFFILLSLCREVKYEMPISYSLKTLNLFTSFGLC